MDSLLLLPTKHESTQPLYCLATIQISIRLESATLLHATLSSNLYHRPTTYRLIRLQNTGERGNICTTIQDPPQEKYARPAYTNRAVLSTPLGQRTRNTLNSPVLSEKQPSMASHTKMHSVIRTPQAHFQKVLPAIP